MTRNSMIARILNRLGMLRHFNLNCRIAFNQKSYVIPVLKTIGFFNLYLFQDYDFKVYRFFAEVIKKGIFLDVGANIGQTVVSVHSLSADNRIVCLEPNTNCVVYLNQLKASNQMSNVEIIPAALFDEPGIQKLYIGEEVDTGATLIRRTTNESYVLVNAINYAGLEKLLNGRVSFVKIDVEGAELQVLQCLRQLFMTHQPVIYCEVLDAGNESNRNANNEHKREVFELVTVTLGYDVFSYNAMTEQLTPTNAFPDRIFAAENLDLNNYVFMPRARNEPPDFPARV